MENNSFANLANYSEKAQGNQKRRKLSEALETLSKILDIEFGSLTVHFHKGKCAHKVEIKKNIMHEIE